MQDGRHAQNFTKSINLTNLTRGAKVEGDAQGTAQGMVGLAVWSPHEQDHDGTSDVIVMGSLSAPIANSVLLSLPLAGQITRTFVGNSREESGQAMLAKRFETAREGPTALVHWAGYFETGAGSELTVGLYSPPSPAAARRALCVQYGAVQKDEKTRRQGVAIWVPHVLSPNTDTSTIILRNVTVSTVICIPSWYFTVPFRTVIGIPGLSTTTAYVPHHRAFRRRPETKSTEELNSKI